MTMRWWGWGAPETPDPLEGHPAAWPFLQEALKLDVPRETPPVPEGAIQLPPSRLEPALVAELAAVVGEIHVSTQAKDRLTHAFGKSTRDLLRIRKGDVPNPPDAVVFPSSAEQVAGVFKLASAHGFAVIPFGGGSSVVGGLEMPASQRDRPFVSLDLKGMGALVDLDEKSQLATFQAGVLGPRLEALLQERGYTLGHYPQSFEFSSLGGWVATRSAGQQSTRYGKIEQLVAGLTLVTPAGELVCRSLPASAEGPDLKQAVIGSEGVLGVITEVTVRVRPVPERRDYRAYLFPSWAHGTDAVRRLMQSELKPATVRLSDAHETRALMKLASTGEPGRFQKAARKLVSWYWERTKALRTDTACMLVIGFEGPADSVDHDREKAHALLEQGRAVALGTGVGRSWYANRFSLPYLRDALMDRAVLAETLETAATWEKLPAVYESVRAALTDAIRQDGLAPLVLCHVSHPYAIGASLYFTFACAQDPVDGLAQWARYKRAATEAIVSAGGALSHHHAVGLDHAPWWPRVSGEAGVAMLAGLKAALDPQGLANPGKILPDGAS